MLTAAMLFGVGAHDKAAGTPKKKQQIRGNAAWAMLHVILLLLFTLLLCSLLLEHVYWKYVTPIVDSYQRQPMQHDFYPDYENEFTYYNRHCRKSDISTTDSNDLLITPQHSSQQAANVMLEHGAVAFQNVLSDQTATELRAYLADKHAHNLSYNEVFWQEQDRLSLGVGTHDHPSIADALQQIGTHATIQTTLEGILGPDPAICEISTLTSLAGAADQGIHSDSDWFGSSLLYAQSFLHSYSLFVALQDTSQTLGATTVCPGSHFCADQDLEAMCLDNGAFSVSTNGVTGEDGLLRKGDAFLFNQNVWHRGPANREESKDRIMFILTFVSSRKSESDRRRQALGTYYYQRWNMWSHTYNDLKYASSYMVQPWAALRALGIMKSRGITWIHQFAQQLANGDDFYADDELADFKRKVLVGVPKFLQSQAENWKEFIPETMRLWTLFLMKAYAVAVLVVGVLSLLRSTQKRPHSRVFAKRVLLSHGAVCLVMYSLLRHIGQTDLAQSVTTGDVSVRPFAIPSDMASSRPTTLPEHNDVLFSSRYDADFLASYKRFLDFHPGNKRWRTMVDHAAQLPKSLRGRASDWIVQEMLATRELGLPTRFLRQDEATGNWEILSQSEAAEETRRAILEQTTPSGGKLAGYLGSITGDTTMARKSPSAFVKEWMSRVPTDETAGSSKYQRPQRKVDKPQSRSSRNLVAPSKDESYQVGDQVWVWDDPTSKWYESVLVEQYDDGVFAMEYNMGGEGTAHPDDIREYVAWKSGDRVDVDYYGTSEEFFAGTITNVHPDGSCSVLYDDGELGEHIGRESLLLPLE